MARVFGERASARQFATTNLGKKLGPVLNERSYVAELHKIDVSDCPKVFRLAWLDYVQAWERHIDLPGKLGRGLEATGSLYAQSGPAFKQAQDRMISADPNEAFRRLQRAAVECGVTPPTE